MTIAHSLVGYRPEGRPESDFYPTPPAATHALLERYDPGPSVWEPACGNGAISRILEARGHQVVSTDLYDHGYGQGQAGVDFLSARALLAPSIVTNPPFRLAEAFVWHAIIGLRCQSLALLCKLAFLEGQTRSKLLEETGLSRVLVFRKRLSMTRGGEKMANSGMIAFAWFVWEPNPEGRPPSVEWI